MLALRAQPCAKSSRAFIRGSIAIATSLCMTLGAHSAPADQMGTAFSYRGLLNDNQQPANGRYDFSFSLYDNLTNGTQVSRSLTNLDLDVTNGLFAAFLDFGSTAFTGEARWLEIAVRTNHEDGFVILTPRQPIGPTPYALFAPSSGIAASATSTASNSVTSVSIENAAVTQTKLAPGAAVRSLNGLTDHLQLAGGSNIVLSSQGNVLNIDATIVSGAHHMSSLSVGESAFPGNAGVLITNGLVTIASTNWNKVRWGDGFGYWLLGTNILYGPTNSYIGAISYNPDHVLGEPTFGLMMESGYPHTIADGIEPGFTRDTELYFYWDDPDGQTNRRAFQAGISWGTNYAGTLPNYYVGRTYWSFQVDKFTIDPENGLMNGGCFTIAFGTNTVPQMSFEGSETLRSNLMVGGSVTVLGPLSVGDYGLFHANPDWPALVWNSTPDGKYYRSTSAYVLEHDQENNQLSLIAYPGGTAGDNLAVPVTVMGFKSTGVTLGADLTTGRIQSSTTVSANKGFVLMAIDDIPTNAIPASTFTHTNFVLINWANAGPVFVATNITATGSFIVAKPALTLTTWP